MKALLAVGVLVAGAAFAQQPINPVHPLYPPLDAEGNKTTLVDKVSVEKTCGACHESGWIGQHTSHSMAGGVSCAECHLDQGRLTFTPEMLSEDGNLKRQAMKVGKPRSGNCERCHGLVSTPREALALPPGFPGLGAQPLRTWSLTLEQGAIVAPQRVSHSFLNVEGKSGLSTPWDVHAARMVDCVACHYAPNDPAVTASRQGSLRYLTDDPRRIEKADFLSRPDHRLAHKDCRSCHAVEEVHGFLPYRARHMAVLACETCHIPGPMGPAAELVDATVVRPDGTPVVHYRNVDRREGEGLNTALITPLKPLLVSRREADGVMRLAPVNLVSRYRWVAGPTKEAVPMETLSKAMLEAGQYVKPIADGLDANHDGRLEDKELRLDTPARVELVAAALRSQGVVDPAIDGLLEAHPLAHGVLSARFALSDCNACHAADSRFASTYPVLGFVPGGQPPRPAQGTDLSGEISTTTTGGLQLNRVNGAGELHVLGLSRQATTNTVGFAMFALLSVGLSAHALGRFLLRNRRKHDAPHGAMTKKYVFRSYERLWHWTMAFSGIVLIVTGLAIHGAGSRWSFSLPLAVSFHNVFATILMLNAGFSLMYHLATKAITNFIPNPRGLLRAMIDQIEYQSRGIFFGGSHPSNEPGKKLNPVQQLTYLALLNILFPVQIITGLLLWAVGNWPALGAAVSGLHLVGPIHNLGSWLFISFFVLHVYLVTTGRTVTEHLESMVTGYQSEEEHS